MTEKLSCLNEDFRLEKARLRQDIALLETTSGYAKLSSTQKQLIRITLYLQARAERDMDPDHLNDPWYYDWLVKDGNREAKYQNCLKHIKRWNCHGAIAALEKGQICLAEDPPENLSEFFDAQYLEIHNPKEISSVIKKIGYPCVVHINDELGNNMGESTQWHSFIALGELSDGKIVTWEKIGFQLPYRVADLEIIQYEYDYAKFWGFRKLRGVK